jgi:rRNA maturation endonuclease Nob1
MSKDDTLEKIGTAAAIIGGAWILSEIIKGLSKQVYLCPCCKKEIEKHQTICPHCRTPLLWKQQ